MAPLVLGSALGALRGLHRRPMLLPTVVCVTLVALPLSHLGSSRLVPAFAAAPRLVSPPAVAAPGAAPGALAANEPLQSPAPVTALAAAVAAVAGAFGCAAAAKRRGTVAGRGLVRQTVGRGRVTRRFFGGDEEDPYSKCTAIKLEVGLQFSSSFLKGLNKLAETSDSSTDEGLHQLLLDVIVALRRAESTWRYGHTERLVFDSEDPAREAGAALQRWGLDAQTKFGDDNEWSKLDKRAPSGVTEYVVLTLLVSCYGPICPDKEDLKVRSVSDVRAILDSISGIQVDELTQLDVQWIPEEEGDSFGAMEVTMKFPELASL